MKGYADPSVAFNPFDASIASGTDQTNLVYRAAELLVGPTTGVTIHLQKLIPHGAGLGGGSSDAAATLLAVSKLLGLSQDLRNRASKTRLRRIR